MEESMLIEVREGVATFFKELRRNTKDLPRVLEVISDIYKKSVTKENIERFAELAVKYKESIECFRREIEFNKERSQALTYFEPRPHYYYDPNFEHEDYNLSEFDQSANYFAYIPQEGDIKLDDNHWMTPKGKIYRDFDGEEITKGIKLRTYASAYKLICYLRVATKPLGKEYFEENTDLNWETLRTMKFRTNFFIEDYISTDSKGRYYLTKNKEVGN